MMFVLSLVWQLCILNDHLFTLLYIAYLAPRGARLHYIFGKIFAFHLFILYLYKTLFR